MKTLVMYFTVRSLRHLNLSPLLFVCGSPSMYQPTSRGKAIEKGPITAGARHPVVLLIVLVSSCSSSESSESLLSDFVSCQSSVGCITSVLRRSLVRPVRCGLLELSSLTSCSVFDLIYA